MTIFSAWRFRTRLAAISLIGIAPALGIMAFAQSTDRRRAEAIALDNTRRVARVAAGQQAASLDEADRLLSTLARFPEIGAEAGDDCSTILARALGGRPTYVNITVLRTDGSLVCAGTPSEPGRASSGAATLSRALLRQVIQTGKAAVGDYGESDANSQPGIVLAHPIVGQSGAVDGILAATLASLDRNWAEADVDAPPGGTLTLFDQHRTVLASYPGNSRSIGRILPEGFAVDRTASTDRVVETAGLDGIRRVYTLVPLATGPSSRLFVAMGLERSAVFVDVNHLLWRQLSMILIVSIAAIGAGLVGGEFFVRRPIEKITTAAARLATGDFTARAALKGRVPGMTELGGAIDAMAAALDGRRRERDRAEQQLRRSEHQNNLRQIHLLLTDVVLPDIDGHTLAKRVLRQHPRAAVLYVSGYANDTIVMNGVLEPGIWFLPKPFSGDMLMAKVREILDAVGR